MHPSQLHPLQKKKIRAWHQMNTDKQGMDDCEHVVSHDIATDRS